MRLINITCESSLLIPSKVFREHRLLLVKLLKENCALSSNFRLSSGRRTEVGGSLLVGVLAELLDGDGESLLDLFLGELPLDVVILL